MKWLPKRPELTLDLDLQSNLRPLWMIQKWYFLDEIKAMNTFRFVRRISAEKVHSKHSPNVENMKTREYPYRHGLYQFSQSEGIKYLRI